MWRPRPRFLSAGLGCESPSRSMYSEKQIEKLLRKLAGIPKLDQSDLGIRQSSLEGDTLVKPPKRERE